MWVGSYVHKRVKDIIACAVLLNIEHLHVELAYKSKINLAASVSYCRPHPNFKISGKREPNKIEKALT